MIRNRRTIGGELLFDGIGIHSGERSSVRMAPLSDGHGVRFTFGGRSYGIEDAQSVDSRRNTEVLFPDGTVLRTVEHLLAAIAGVGLDDVLIEVDGTEIPILDGSALPFAQGILEMGFADKGDEYIPRSITAPVCIDSGKSSIVAIPSEELRITYVIDYPGTAIGTEMKDVLITTETFLSDIAPARTFGLLSEVEALQKSGLGLGGDLENVIIIGEDGPLNTVGYKIKSECAAHKITDLLGDLALVGTILCAHYICVCGGHWLHSKLALRLKRLIEAN
ncbi:MAG: UDP-3-O-acyl-N-acetylglucosamine deacetylase [Synergistaceae bacterium]|nr:UDP-3-O-acyl-N-acetylglucosamine deacetylase [Synergistaceae bacterium]